MALIAAARRYRLADADLSGAEVDLLIEALDSHEYWQISDPDTRNSGYVAIMDEDLNPDDETEAEILECRQLTEKLEAWRRALPVHAPECDMGDDCTCGAE